MDRPLEPGEGEGSKGEGAEAEEIILCKRGEHDSENQAIPTA